MAQPEAKPLTRQETAARNRERLLDASARVIQRSGLGGASLEDIAADAGLTKGAIYSQFDSKEELLIELLDKRFEVGHSALREILGQSTPFAGQLNQLESEHRGEKDGEPTLSTLELELSLAAVRQPRLREKMVSRQKRYRSLLAEVIEQIAADQKLELPMRAQDLAIALSALCDGLLVAGLNDPESVPDDLLAQFILSTVIAASKPKA